MLHRRRPCGPFPVIIYGPVRARISSRPSGLPPSSSLSLPTPGPRALSIIIMVDTKLRRQLSDFERELNTSIRTLRKAHNGNNNRLRGPHMAPTPFFSVGAPESPRRLNVADLLAWLRRGFGARDRVCGRCGGWGCLCPLQRANMK